MAVTKLGIYNDVAVLLGQRILATDTDDVSLRYKMDQLYDNGAVDYCLEVAKPRFATKLTSLTGVTPTLTTAFTNEATLPSTFQTLIGVYADGYCDQEIKRFTHEGDKILSDFPTIFVRFIQDFATVGLTTMSFAFARVVAAYIARELSITIDPDETENLDKILVQRLEICETNDSLTEDPNRAKDSPTALTAAYYQIFNDALQILGLPRLVSTTDDSQRRNALDLALLNGVVEATLEDKNWGFGIETSKITYNAAYTTVFGPIYGTDLPADVHRLDGVWIDEYMNVPIRDYKQEYLASAGNDVIYSDYQELYIQYVSADFISDPGLWPKYFRRLIAGKLAIDAGPQIPNSNMDNAKEQFAARDSDAKSIDAIVSPPKKITDGAWAGSRWYGSRGRNRDRP